MADNAPASAMPDIVHTVMGFADGNWFDMISFGVAVFYAISRWKKCDRAYHLVSSTTGSDIMNGVSLFPLFMLGLSVFSSRALEALLTSNKLILSTAGCVALFAVLEVSRPQQTTSQKLAEEPTTGGAALL
ncbi:MULTISPECIES: hypothetical protein [Agrobacterium]|uniref:Uncharacterized protein n=1 Tax=Agrobacterium tumefaciens TaxID=358 RepID=A0AAF0K9T4_AGRTU|nr:MULTISPECIES: hypothetical protein [Agrobacterium]WGM61747.1 hypothetical protein CFBP5506_19205 [Agrobacterium tumefaciens]